MRQDMIDSGMSEAEADQFVDDMTGGSPSGAEPGTEPSPGPNPAAALDEVKKVFEDFQGAAATVRFDDGALELEVAADSAMSQAQGVQFTDGGGDAIADLPEGTVAALGMSLEDGWFESMLDQMSSMSGQDPQQFVAQAEQELGLSLPEDVEALTGDSFALALGGDFDPEAMANSEDVSELPFGVRITGDSDRIEAVLDKLRKNSPEAEAVVSQTDGDTVAIGANKAYVDELIEGGNLGDSDVFDEVVPDADGAGMVFFLDVDAGDWLTKLVGDDQQARENIEPLSAVGATGSVDGDVSHLKLRITTD